MTSYRNSAEGGTAGTTVTSGSGGNTGGTSGRYFDAAVVFKFMTGWGSGNRCYGLDSVGTGTPTVRWADGAVNKTSRGRFYYGDSASWPSDLQILRVTDAADSVNVFSLVGKSTQKLRLMNGSGTQVWESTNNLPHDLSRVRVEWRDHSTGTSASDGTLRVAYFLGDSTTPTEDSGLLTGSFGSGTNISMFRFGKLTSGSYSGNFRLDELAVDTGSDAIAGTWIGPVVTNVAPTLSLSVDKSTIHPGEVSTITATASDSDGTIASLTWSTTVGSLVGSGTTRTLTAPASSVDQTATVQVIATDNSGATDTRTIAITLKASMSKVFNGAAWVPIARRIFTP